MHLTGKKCTSNFVQPNLTVPCAMHAIDRAAVCVPSVSSAVSWRLRKCGRVACHAPNRPRHKSHPNPFVVARPLISSRRNVGTTSWESTPSRRTVVMSSTSDTSPTVTSRSAVIVGAGPSGALTGLYLVRLGWSVFVVDKNTENENENTNEVVMLSRRGLGVLRDAGGFLDSERYVTLEGAVQHNGHNNKLTTTQYKNFVAIGERDLVASIKKSIEKVKSKSGGVTFVYGASLNDIDFANKVAEFESNIAEVSSTSYDLLVGADGLDSATRNLMCQNNVISFEQNSDRLFSKRIKLTNKSLTDTVWQPNHLHTWAHGIRSVTATPSIYGTYEITVTLPEKEESGRRNNETKKNWTWSSVLDASDAEEMLRDLCPELILDSDVSDLIDSLIDRPLTPHGLSTSCSRLSDINGSCVLIGTSGHSIWPTLISNENANLETAQYLGAALEEAFLSKREGSQGSATPNSNTKNSRLKTDTGKQKNALTYFERVRKPQVDSLRRLSEHGFGSGDVGVERRIENVTFFFKIFWLNVLHKVLPFAFELPVLNKIEDPSWGYDDIEDETKRESGVLFSVFFSIFVGVFAIRFFGFWATVDTIYDVVKAIVVGDSSGEGLAVAVLTAVAAVTAAWRIWQKWSARKREKRRGNMTA